MTTAVTLKVEGMSCGGCSGAVQKALEAQGASDVVVVLATKLATMNYTGDATALVDAVKGMGKAATLVNSITLKVNGMSCGGCVGAVTKAVEGLGAMDVNVDLDSGLAKMKWEGDVEKMIVGIKDGSGKTATVV